MEAIKVRDPKDEKILNKDDSVTNKANGTPNGTGQQDQHKQLVPITDNDTPGQLGDESTSNKGQGPSGENL